jgi:hypothetical protein
MTLTFLPHCHYTAIVFVPNIVSKIEDFFSPQHSSPSAQVEDFQQEI